MPKAKTIDRLEYSKQRCPNLKANAQTVIPPEYTKENSRFLKMVAEMKKEHPELAALDDEHTCPVCGGEVIPYEGCYRCKKCGWARC